MASEFVEADKIGSLLFCATCGTLLDVPSKDEDVIKCEPCGTVHNASVYDNLSITTSSHPSAFPSTLRQKRQLVQSASTQDAPAKQATIREKCQKCGVEEVEFHTVQMRSADEGSTVFYNCPKCGHNWSLQN